MYRMRNSPVASDEGGPSSSPVLGPLRSGAHGRAPPWLAEGQSCLLKQNLLLEEADNDQEDHGADDRVDDRRQISSDQDEPDPRQQQPAMMAPTMPTTMLPTRPRP
jgi:hypothetical protein